MHKKAKAYVLSVMQLLKPFVWYIGFYGFYFFLVMVDYFNPPAEDDPLFGSVATLDSWNYINREVYVESQKLGILIDVLIFLLATSNIKNHPKIAKFIFLIPWIQACFKSGLNRILMFLSAVGNIPNYPDLTEDCSRGGYGNLPEYGDL